MSTIQMKEEFFEGKGGIKLCAHSWRPAEKPRAVVVAVHGYKAHGGLFDWAGEQLAARGIAVYSIDLRGHGRSEGERQYVEHFADYVADVDKLFALARSREGNVPIFLLGHSAGGVVSAVYTLEHQKELAGFICESFAHEVPAPEFALAVIKGLGHVAPHLHVLDLKDELFSRDPAFVERMRKDPLIDHTSYPAHSVAEMVRADERLKVEFPLVTLPILILHGTADKVTVPRGSQRFYDRAGSTDKTLKLYEAHFHDLLNDTGRERVMADIVEWIELRMPR